MGASPSRLEQLEALVRALQGANAQLERQLLAVSKEADAGRRAELLLAIQADNTKTRKQNEVHQRELTEEEKQVAAWKEQDVQTLERLRGLLGRVKQVKQQQPQEQQSSEEQQVSDPPSSAFSCSSPSSSSALAAGSEQVGQLEQALDLLELQLAECEQQGEKAAVQRAALLQQLNEAAQGQQSLHARVASVEQELQQARVKAAQLTKQLRAKERDCNAGAEERQTLHMRLQQQAVIKKELLLTCERLLQERGLPPVCRTAGCTSSVTRKEAAPAAASSSFVDRAAPPACACATVASEQDAPAFFYSCSNGHSSQCEACWEQDIQKVCTTWMRGEVSGAVTAGSAADVPADALMRALSPPILVPESKSSATVVVTASAASPSSPPGGASGTASAASSDNDELRAAYTRRTCPSCKETYHCDGDMFPSKVPRLLQCAHTLCTACAQRVVAETRAQNMSFLSCCTCGEPTLLAAVEADTLPEAVAIMELVRRLGAQSSTGALLCSECSEQDATVLCEQCVGSDPVCEPCFIALHPARSKVKKDHVPKPASGPTAPLCPTHKKPLRHFCSQELCWVALCEACLPTHGSTISAAIAHSIQPLQDAAAHYLRQVTHAGHLLTASAGVDELARLVPAWLEQARQAQAQMRHTQELANQHLIQLTQVLQAKGKSYTERGLLRRTASAGHLSRMAALHATLVATLVCDPHLLLREAPGILRQLQDEKDASAQEHLNWGALNLKLFTTFLAAIPVKAEAITTRLSELADAPLTDKLVRVRGYESLADGQTKSPGGVAVAGGLVYVTDLKHHCVLVFSTVDGSFVRTWGSHGSADGEMKQPCAVAVAGELVYVADSNHRVQVFSTVDGSFVRKWSRNDSADGQVNYPCGVAVAEGLVYVTDSINNRVRVFPR